MASVDAILLTEVYAAGEAKIVGADTRALCRAIRLNCKIEPIFVEDVQDMAAAILDIVVTGDVVLCMGAGSISTVSKKIVNLLNH
jgi:UDP-N-acetylmuramate--alanine ligase